MGSVAISEPLLLVVSAEAPERTDRVVTVEADTPDSPDGRPDDCDCVPQIEQHPCWPCYIDGFEGPNLSILSDKRNYGC